LRWCHFVPTLLGSHSGDRFYAEGGSQGTWSLRKGASFRHLVERFKDAGVEHREKVNLKPAPRAEVSSILSFGSEQMVLIGLRSEYCSPD